MSKQISLKSVVGKGYSEFWNTRKTYAVCKGSRGSKKSKTSALWHITHMMKFPLSNTLVIRKVERTLRDSAFSDLQWAIDRLQVSHLWKCTTSPLEITYIPTGQKILFRGLDSPFKITSISVPRGVLNFIWVEEAYEILKEDDFNMVDESIRGILPEGYFKRVTITFNPWSELHWLKPRFFDIPQDNVLAMTTTYKCNEFLSETDIAMYEDVRRRNPSRARIVCDGEWGIAEGVIFENWSVEDLSKKTPEFDHIYNGCDWGWTDPTAMLKIHLDRNRKRIYVIKELYQQYMTDEMILEAAKEFTKGNQYIVCDSADPRMINYLASNGVKAIPTIKNGVTIVDGIRWLQGYEIIIDIQCQNFINEISLYHWKTDKFGNTIESPAEGNDHLLDCLRYSCIDEIIGAEAKAGIRI